MAESQPTSVVENWKPVVGYEGYYEVSNLGRVRGLDRVVPWNGTTRVYKGRIRIAQLGAGGYLRVNLTRCAKRSTRTVHSLVLEAHCCPRPEGMDCCHNDGCRTNNCITNLRWDTRSENARDRARHGYVSPVPASAKLTYAQVVEIKRDYRAGSPRTASGPVLGKKYGVSSETIYRVLRGEHRRPE